MKVRVGNACWHAVHVLDATIAKELGFFEQEGLDAEIVHGKIYQEGIASSRQGGPRYEEERRVLPEMIQYNIDIVTDTWLTTLVRDRLEGQDELRAIGVWKNQDEVCLVAAPGIDSVRGLRGKRLGEWMSGSPKATWIEMQLRRVGLDPEKDVRWMVGWEYGSHRETARALRAGKVDAAMVQYEDVPGLLEEGFVKLFDLIRDYPQGRPSRMTVARESFIKRNPELIKRYWKAAIRSYHFVRIVPEHYPFIRYCEAKLRTNNPDEQERMRPLKRMETWPSYHGSMNGQTTTEGLENVLAELKEFGKAPSSFTLGDLKGLLRMDLVQEAWDELQKTDEVKANLERLQPVIERLGY